MQINTFGKGLIAKGKITPEYIIIHNTAAQTTAKASATYNYTQTIEKKLGTGFCNYYVDDIEVVKLAEEGQLTWNCGNSAYNKKSISIEIAVNPMACYLECQEKKCEKVGAVCLRSAEKIKKFIEAEKNTLELVRAIQTRWNIPNDKILFHSEVKATACPYFTKKLHGITKGREFVSKIAQL